MAFCYQDILKLDDCSRNLSPNIEDVVEPHYEWNHRYQRAMSLPEKTLHEKLLKYQILNGINRDFITSSSDYAKTIISEYFLPDCEKSVRPKEIGGTAGGKKYLWRGVLFKLADGSRKPYDGCFEAAAKAVGHELKGANSYFRCAIPGLHVTLQASIDYKGFRMHAQAYLPIGKDTIRIGSANAGKTVHANQEYINRMKWASQELNIREHVINGKVLYSACDVEGHIGDDARFYLIDLARTFPPEAKSATKHLYETGDIICNEPEYQNAHSTIFWRLLRPEYVKHRGREVLKRRSHYLKRNLETTYLPEPSNEESAPILSDFSHLKMNSFPGTNIGITELKEAHQRSYSIDSSNGYNKIEQPSTAVNKPKTYSEALMRTATAASTTTTTSSLTASTHKSFYNDPNDFVGDNLNNQNVANHYHTGYGDSMLHRSGNGYCSYSGFFSEDTYGYVNTLDPSYSHYSNLYESCSENECDNQSVKTAEAVDSSSIPSSPDCLSSDAFSRFSLNDPEYPIRNEEVETATKHLVESLIPALAIDLIRGGKAAQQGLTITAYMHLHGVNVRHCGLLRQNIILLSSQQQLPISPSRPTGSGASGETAVDDTDSICRELLLECICRTLKNLLRLFQRSWMSANKSTSEQGLCEVIVRFMNLITGNHPNCELFWENVVVPGIVRRFGICALEGLPLRNNSQQPGNSNDASALGGGNIAVSSKTESTKLSECSASALKSSLWKICCDEGSLLTIIHRLRQMTGIVLTDSCLAQLSAPSVESFEFVVTDIFEIRPVIKHMHQVDLREGILLLLRAQVRESSSQLLSNPFVTARLMSLAINSLHAALKAVPDDLQTRSALADAYQMRADALLRTGDNEMARKSFYCYRNLDSRPHTRCSKLKLAYRDDILGVSIIMTHVKDKSRSFKLGFPVVKIKDVQVEECLEQLSLTYFLSAEVKGQENAVASTTDNSTTTTGSSTSEVKSVDENDDDDYSSNVPIERLKLKRRFLPLIVDEEHAMRALPLLKEELIRMDVCGDDIYRFSLPHDHCPVKLPEDLAIRPLPPTGALRHWPEFDHILGFRVLSAIMNGAVVSFCRKSEVTATVTATDGKKPNDGFSLLESEIVGYTRFHHILLFLSSQDPRWVAESNKEVRRFINDPEYRKKSCIGDLGRFLIHLLLSDQDQEVDNDFISLFLLESLSRQVSWFCKPVQTRKGFGYDKNNIIIMDRKEDEKFPELMFLESDPVCPYRLGTTFKASLTSLRMLMFQVYFLFGIARRSSSESSQSRMLNLYNSSLGNPTAAMRGGLSEEFQSILKVSNYESFFHRIGVRYTPAQFTTILRNAVRYSILRKYEKSFKKEQLVNMTIEPIPDDTAQSDWDWGRVEKEYRRKSYHGDYSRLVRDRRFSLFAKKRSPYPHNSRGSDGNNIPRKLYSTVKSYGPDSMRNHLEKKNRFNNTNTNKSTSSNSNSNIYNNNNNDNNNSNNNNSNNNSSNNRNIKSNDNNNNNNKSTSSNSNINNNNNNNKSNKSNHK